MDQINEIFKSLGEDIPSKETLFKSLKENKDKIIEYKKSNWKEAHLEGIEPYDNSKIKAFDTEEGYFYAVINTTNIVDYSKDLHLDSIWNKTAKEQNGKIHYVSEHSDSIDGLIVHKSDVDIQLKKTSFKSLGFNLEGETTALVFKMKEDAILHEKMKKIVSKRYQVENSVRMMPVNVLMAINSDAPEFEEEKKNWDKYINKASNKKDVEEDGYFFPITEAKISVEGSATTKGVNSATGIIYHKEDFKNIEPFKDTHNEEPLNNTLEKQIDFKSLTEKFKL